VVPSPTPQIILRHTRRIITEPDEFGEAVSGMSLSVHYQRKQQRASTVEQFQSSEWALDFGEANVRTLVSGVLVGGWGSFCFSRGPGTASWNSQTAAQGCAGLLPPGEGVEGYTTADFSWLTVAISAKLWQQCQTLAGLEDYTFGGLSSCPLESAAAQRMELTIRKCRSWLRAGAMETKRASSALALRDVGHFVSESFVMFCEIAARMEPKRDSFRNRVRLVKRAETWIREHLGDAIQVPDVCLALGVSRRELEYAFRSILDQSPRDYLQILRLHAIRIQLMRYSSEQSDPVITTAYENGVSHLGRFSANYRKLFGELPSETVRRKRCENRR
jgi:AraC family transcriptional regulator, ethanolamine operon transcriptional activator